MGCYHIEEVGRDYNKEILDILRSAPNVSDRLTVCFDRQPDFFALPDIRYDPYQYFGYFRDNDLKGFCGLGYHNGMLNGAVRTIFHMRDYYVLPESRGIGFGMKVTEKFFKETHDDANTGYVVILEGNKASLSYIGRRSPSFPYVPWSRIINKLEVRNIMIIWPVPLSRKYLVRRAVFEDIPAIVELLNNEHRHRLFGKVYSGDTFLKYIESCTGLQLSDYYLAIDRRGKLCGVCAAWDCSTFKQTRVLQYGRSFRAARIAFKGLAAVFRLPSLPSEGESFRDLILTDYGVEGRDPEIMNALLKTIYSDARRDNFQNIMWGSSADDPLLEATKGFFCQSIRSNIILISTDQSMMEPSAVHNNLPWIELPCL
ncbi:MAG: hypothetical protein MUE74_10205 [Bacteroidales bacterium]|jgi:hypothetical protein|nr:hypothetical protein [Bacteroidales bacterium]